MSSKQGNGSKKIDFNSEQTQSKEGGYDPYVPKRSFASKIYNDVDNNIDPKDPSSKKKKLEEQKKQKKEEKMKQMAESKQREEEERRAKEDYVDFLN